VTRIQNDAAAYAVGIGGIVDTLQAAGARRIVVLNNGNAGLAPFILEADKLAPGAAALASGAALAYNTALGMRLTGEQRVQTFDTFGFISALTADPAAHGLTNVVDACGAAPVGTDCSSYLFWDGVHPTTAVHGQLANAIHAQVVPEPETYALMAFGLGVVAWAARRRQRRGA
jgi:outer membrane lipase/esterase